MKFCCQTARWIDCSVPQRLGQLFCAQDNLLSWDSVGAIAHIRWRRQWQWGRRAHSNCRIAAMVIAMPFLTPPKFKIRPAFIPRFHLARMNQWAPTCVNRADDGRAMTPVTIGLDSHTPVVLPMLSMGCEGDIRDNEAPSMGYTVNPSPSRPPSRGMIPNPRAWS